MTGFRTLDDLDVKGRRVLVRVDFNVPMRDGKVTDMSRIARAAATIDELAREGARVILLSHFDRPKGRRVPSMSLKPLVAPLEAALGGRKVAFAEDCVGDVAMAAAATLKDGDVLLLENLRFHGGEEADDPDFAARLADLGEIYVNDAFSAAHRAHASTVDLAKLLPAAAGRLMEAELTHLEKALGDPARPLGAIVGGAKVSTKLELLGNLVAKVDTLVIGGGMANTFLFAQGIEVGRSLCERDMAETARAILAEAKESNCRIVLPEDAAVAAELVRDAAVRTVPIGAVPPEMMILDIGPRSVDTVIACLGDLRTLVWNGPVGAFETPPFDAGTVAIARAVGRLTKGGALLSVAGGGDTVAALAQARVLDQLSYVSTAGGAFLEWLEGKRLPGVAALMRPHRRS
jgi:phosphoglycerate kinase